VEQNCGSEPNIFKYIQEFNCILWDKKLRRKSTESTVSLSWARSNHSIPSHTICLELSLHLRLDLKNDLFPSGFRNKTLHPFLFFSLRATNPTIFHLNFIPNCTASNARIP